MIDNRAQELRRQRDPGMANTPPKERPDWPVTPVENVTLQKRPVAFRVPTGDGGWLLMLNEEAAQIEADKRGVGYDGLYVRSNHST